MISSKFKEIYNIIKQQQEGIFKVEKENIKDNNPASDLKHEEIEKSYILKQCIKKDGMLVDLYLIHFLHTNSPQLDANYKPLPLTTKEIYEYDAIISMLIDDKIYDISGIFGGIEYDKDSAVKKYSNLLEKMKSLSEEEIVKEMECFIATNFKS